MQWKYFNHQNLKRFKVKTETWVWTLGGFYSAISHSVKGNAQKMIFGRGTRLTVNSGELKYIFNKYIGHYVQNNMILFLELKVQFNTCEGFAIRTSQSETVVMQKRWLGPEPVTDSFLWETWSFHSEKKFISVSKSKIFSWTRTGNKNSNQRRSVTTISRHVICQCGSVMLHRCQVHSLLTSLILTGLHGRNSQNVLYWVSTSDILLLVCSVRWRWFFKNKQSQHCCHFCL